MSIHSGSCREFHSHVPSTWTQKKTQMSHWNFPVEVGTLSSRVSMMYLGVHMQKNKDHLCFYTTVAIKWLWAGTQYHVSKTAPTNHKLGSPGWTYAVIWQKKSLSHTVQKAGLCVLPFFQKELVKHIRLIKPWNLFTHHIKWRVIHSELKYLICPSIGIGYI